MEMIAYALIIAAVLCLMESRSCTKRARMWDAIAELEQQIEELKKRKRL